MVIKYRVLILGYGEMGRAMYHLLNKHHFVDVWVRNPKAYFQVSAFDTVAPNTDFVIFCLPANPHKKIAKLLAPQLKKTCICLSIAKGLDEDGKTVAEVFADVFADKLNYALLYGPMISEEICASNYAFAQLGCHTIDIYNSVNQLFNNTSLRIEYTVDIVGISWAVILKNVYAILFGVTDELQMGGNVRGYLASASLKELGLIVLTMNGQTNSVYSLAGLADLITTATSENSHHHELGTKLARGENLAIEGEGIHTLEMVNKYKLFATKKYPLFYLIDSIIKQPNKLHKKIDRYLVQPE